MKVVAESYTCGSLPDGKIQDYHARVNDILVTRSSGNARATNAGTDTYDACPDTWNSVCVGSTNSAKDRRSCYSIWKNPHYLTSPVQDREEPDVVAFGGDGMAGNHYECAGVADDGVSVASATQDLSVLSRSGTSFASPAVAALAALTQEYCADRLRPVPSALKMRSWLRTSAAAANPDGWNYSTLQQTFTAAEEPRPGDHKDGGGFVNGPFVKKLCDTAPNPNEAVATGEVTIASNTDGTPANGGPSATPAFPDVPPGELAVKKGPLNQTLAPSPTTTGYMYRVLHEHDLVAGDRMRFTYSWNRCANNATTGLGQNLVMDFDIFLYNETLDQGLYASQTADDTNEGFDVIIPEGWNGHYQVLLYWPTSASVCSGGEKGAYTAYYQFAP